MRSKARGTELLAAVVAIFFTVSGLACGDNEESTDSISFRLASTECGSARVAAGPIIVNVRNAGASRTDELQILENGRTLGKITSIPRGQSGAIPLVLKEGTYTLLCATSDPPTRGELKVVGDSPMENRDLTETAVARYRSYLEKNAKGLVGTVAELAHKVKIKYLGSAQSRYAYARVFYSQIAPFAKSFSHLDRRIDALSKDVPANEFGGFHRIEKALWAEETSAGLLPVAEQLLGDIKELQSRVRTSDLQPVLVASAASALLDEVAKSTVTGRGEPYSHTDMIDISANVEGAEAVFEAIRPLLDEKAPDLVEEVETRFESSYSMLTSYGHPARESGQRAEEQPGISFPPYELSKAEIRKFSRPLKALAAIFSQVPMQIIN